MVDSDRPNLDRLVVGERVWPPTYEGAPNTLRVVSFDWAAKALAYRLHRVWLEYLEGGAAARRAEK